MSPTGTGVRRGLGALVLVSAVVAGSAGCGALGIGGDDTTGRQITIKGDSALLWGDGSYGVVLAHGASYDAASWEDQATAIADVGATVVAVEDISPETIADAVAYLKGRGVADVALIGGSRGADAILDLSAAQPALPDQIITLSANHVVEGLGEEPALFVASEDEPLADVSSQLASASPGPDTQLVLLPGKTHAQGIFTTDRGPTVLKLITDRVRTYGVDQ